MESIFRNPFFKNQVCKITLDMGMVWLKVLVQQVLRIRSKLQVVHNNNGIQATAQFWLEKIR